MMSTSRTIISDTLIRCATSEWETEPTYQAERFMHRHINNQLRAFLMIESFNTGGTERQFAILANNLDKANVEVSIGCVRASGPFVQQVKDVSAFPIGGSLYKLKSWQTRYGLAKVLKKRRIEVAQSFDFYTNLILIPAARFAGLPVVLGSQRQLGDLLTPRQQAAQMLVFRMTDAVVCNSTSAADRLEASGVPRRKLKIIRNGLTNELLAEVKPVLSDAPGIFRVGMVARMNTTAKNHSALLRAVSKLKATQLDVEVFLAGDGYLRSDLERESFELGISGKVHFLGEVRDVPALIRSMDVCVLPSTSESLSNALLEAMAQAVPVIASETGDNRELLDGGRGILLQRPDPSVLADALLTMASNKCKRKSIGVAGQRYVRENFTSNIMVSAYEKLYRELLDQKRGGRTRNLP